MSGRPGKSRRSMSKVYDVGNGTISITFPKFISELMAVAQAHETDSIKEITSILQGMCLSQGIKPVWNKWTQEDENKRKRVIGRAEQACRNVQREEALAKARADVGMSFPERVAVARKLKGDS